jgi:hypothetical protein
MSFLLLPYVSLQQNWRIGQNRLCLEARGWGGREEAWGRNDPNNVCTYEYMNKEKKEIALGLNTF